MRHLSLLVLSLAVLLPPLRPAVARPSATGRLNPPVRAEDRALGPITGDGLACENGHAGIFECDHVDLVAFLPLDAMGAGPGVTANDMWGWQDPDTGRAYAIVGLRDGTAFVDVTKPAYPVFVGKLPRSEGAPTSLWRDMKVYGSYVFVVADASGRHGVQIFDLTHLREFGGEPLTFAEDAHYAEVRSIHNIAINEDTGFAYAVGNSAGGRACGGAVHMIDIEDPLHPVFAGCYEPLRLAGGRPGPSHDAQCVIYHGPDARHAGREICFTSDGRALDIGDVTDKRHPELLASVTYPKLGYTHQGWLDEQHEYFYLDDEGDELAGLVAGTRTLIWDVRDLEDPVLVAEHVADSPATDHNLFVRGDRMYQSNYRSGLHVYDISDREDIHEVGFFDTVPWGGNEGMGNLTTGDLGSWSNYPFFDSGVVAMTSGAEGLFLVRVQEDGGKGP